MLLDDTPTAPDLAPLVSAIDASAISNADVCLAVMAALALLVANDDAELDQLMEDDADRVLRLETCNAVQVRKAKWHGRQGARIEGAMKRTMSKVV